MIYKNLSTFQFWLMKPKTLPSKTKQLSVMARCYFYNNTVNGPFLGYVSCLELNALFEFIKKTLATYGINIGIA